MNEYRIGGRDENRTAYIDLLRGSNIPNDWGCIGSP